MKKDLTLTAVIMVLVAFAANADDAKIMTPEMVVQLESVRSVQISPDGSHVVYSLSTPDSLDEPRAGRKSTTYIIPFEGGEPRMFLSDNGSPSSGEWSPDGKYYTFLASRGGSRQVWALPLGGGEAKKLTDWPESISSYQWNADGSKIAFLARDERDKEIEKKENLGYDMDVIEEDYLFTRLHIMDMASGEVRTVTPAEYQVWYFDWSPDGSQFIVTASDEVTTDSQYMFQRIYLVDAENGERKLLTETEGKLGNPVWSPRGLAIAWNGAVDISDPATGSLFVHDIASGETMNLTGDREETVADVNWLDDKTIVYSVISFQDSLLFTIAPDGSNRTQLLGPGPIFRGVPSFSDDDSRFAMSASTPEYPNEVFVGEVGGELRRLTHSNAALEDVKLGRQEVIEWEASDGWKIQGVLIYPVDYAEGQRYPLVVNPHGGPEGTDMNGWYGSYGKWGHVLAGQGYFVFMPNYRASTGRGVAFTKANHQDLGGREFLDVIDGIDYLVAQGLVDKDRVGSGGGSYGGYFSAIAATKHSERFAASVVFAGPASQYSKIGTTDTAWENAYVHYNLPEWWKEQEKIWSFSPVAYVENSKTATLIAHGEDDRRVPIGQAQELFRNLKAATDVPVQFVVYPRSGHGLGELQHQLDYCKRAVEWFNTYVKNKAVDKDKMD